MRKTELNSAMYVGMVRHRRFSPTPHHFKYSLYMLGLNLDHVSEALSTSWLLGEKWYNPISFNQADYIKSASTHTPLKQRVIEKMSALGGNISASNTIYMLGQARCFGVYFSPVNFYFCYDTTEKHDFKATYMLAEVSNTPWNETHYYLVDLTESEKVTPKEFHVSPFMNLDMQYHWSITPPHERAFIHIENHKKMSITAPQSETKLSSDNKLFDATMQLKKQTLSHKRLLRLWLQLPVMTIKIFSAIYWQAVRLIVKKVPFYAHSKK